MGRFQGEKLWSHVFQKPVQWRPLQVECFPGGEHEADFL